MHDEIAPADGRAPAVGSQPQEAHGPLFSDGLDRSQRSGVYSPSFDDAVHAGRPDLAGPPPDTRDEPRMSVGRAGMPGHGRVVNDHGAIESTGCDVPPVL